MNIRNKENGFSAVEVILLVVIVLAIAGVGYYVWHSNKTSLAPANSTTTKPVAYQSPPTVTPPAPTVTKASDLNAAYQTLNQTSINSNSTDSSQLSVQSNGF